MFTVDSTNGNVTIFGTTTIEKTLTLNGSLTEGLDTLTINNGITTTFEIDSSSGTLCMKGDLKVGGANCDRLTLDAFSGNLTLRGGDLDITTDDPLNKRLEFDTDTGNLITYGNLQVLGKNKNEIEGQLEVKGGNFKVGIQDLSPRWQPNVGYNFGDRVYFGEYIYEATIDGISGSDAPIHTNTTGIANGTTNFKYVETNNVSDLFEIESDGSMNFAGQQAFFSSTGGRRWEYVGEGFETYDCQPNVNYFVNPGANLTMKLPTQVTVDGISKPVRSGDMIRFVDVGGNLTYNVSLICRAADGVFVQGDISNGNNPDLTGINYNGGELVVQTPHASFGLIYLGEFDGEGNPTGAPPSARGWWLMEI